MDKFVFELFNWDELRFEIENGLPYNYIAYAKGDKIVFSLELISQLLCGVITVREFMFILLHECAHVCQQAVLSLTMSPEEVNNYIIINRNRLETEANFFAYRFLKSGNLIPLKCGYVDEKLPLYCNLSAPIQGWAVDGIGSALKQGLDNDKIDELSNKYKEIVENTNDLLAKEILKVKVSTQKRGVHEVFTEDAYDAVLHAMNDSLDESKKKKRRKSLTHGCQFNDRGHSGNLGFAMKYTLKSDKYINQTHEGVMQYLHSMAASEGDYKLDRDKILRWIEFCIDVFEDKKLIVGNAYKNIREMTFKEYWNSLSDNDIMLYMVGRMFFTDTGYKKFQEGHTYKETKDIRKKQLDEAKKMRDYLQNNDSWFSHSSYLNKKIGVFFDENSKDFDAGYVAIGVASHIIQDGFASSHAKRAYDVYLMQEDNEITVIRKRIQCTGNNNSSVDVEPISFPEVDIDCSPVGSGIVCKEVYERDKVLWTGKNKLGDKQQEMFREYLIKKSMPILLFCDYSKQDGDRHGHADLWLDYVNDAESNESERLYTYTLNAEQARDCTEAFMYMVFTHKPKKEILSFIERLYPLAEIPEGFEPSGGGLQYEAFAKYEENLQDEKVPKEVKKGAIKKYEDLTEITISYNWKAGYVERLVIMKSIVLALRDILENKDCVKFHKFYVLHLNELTIELYEMTKQIRSKETVRYKKQYDSIYYRLKPWIEEIILMIQDIYNRRNQGINPLVKKTLDKLR